LINLFTHTISPTRAAIAIYILEQQRYLYVSIM